MYINVHTIATTTTKKRDADNSVKKKQKVYSMVTPKQNGEYNTCMVSDKLTESRYVLQTHSAVKQHRPLQYITLHYR